MTKTQVWVRVGALVVVALLAVYFIAFDVIGWRIGAQPFTVTVDLPRGGGLYSDGFVTYRGVDVGRIASDVARARAARSRRLPSTRARSSPPTRSRMSTNCPSPASSTSTSCRRRRSGPDLHAGSVIPENHTVVPVSVFQLLSDAGQLIGSIKSSEVKYDHRRPRVGLQQHRAGAARPSRLRASI